MGYMRSQTVNICSSSGIDSTGYSTVVNGYLVAVAITTCTTDAWSLATTRTSGLSSTGVIQIGSDRSLGLAGSTFGFLRVAPPGAGGAIYYPLTGGQTSSGGAFSGMSTGSYDAFKFPLSEERLVIQTSSGSDVTAGYAFTVRFITEGA